MNIDTSKHQRVIPENEYQFLMGLVTVEKDLKLITSLLIQFMFNQAINAATLSNPITSSCVNTAMRNSIRAKVLNDFRQFAEIHGYKTIVGYNDNGDICIMRIEPVEKHEVKSNGLH